MQLHLHLRPANQAWLPFSYYHQLGAAFYQALGSVHPDFAEELHHGPDHHSRIKLFGFTPLHSREMQVNKGGPASHRDSGDDGNRPGLLFKGETECLLFSPWPELMNALSEGLLTSRELRVGSMKFELKWTTVEPPPDFREDMVWSPAGPQVSFVTSWKAKDGPDSGKKQFVFPDQGNEDASLPGAAELVRDNLIHKWQRLTDTTGRPDIAARWANVPEAGAKEWIESIRDQIQVDIAPVENFKESGSKPRTRLHHIKQIPVRSWAAPIRIQAPVAIQRLVWSCGLGEMNSMGFGGVK